MSITSTVDRMQIIAANATQKLYFDASETQVFWLYDTVAQTLTQQTSPQAKAFVETGTANFVTRGLTAWNLANLPNNVVGQTNGPALPIPNDYYDPWSHQFNNVFGSGFLL